jgi:hypothetical protein
MKSVLFVSYRGIRSVRSYQLRLPDPKLTFVPRFFGSAQEFVEAHILSRFLKNDEFSLGDRHALSLEQQIAEILVASTSSKEGFDVGVDGFHYSEAHFGAAVVEDAV